jgi:hypothetical protein
MANGTVKWFNDKKGGAINKPAVNKEASLESRYFPQCRLL